MAKETNKSNKTNKTSKEKKEKKSFFKDFKAELKKVSWPTFKQLVNNTSAVIAIVLIVTVIVFVLDVVFENLNTFGVEKLKALVTSSSSESLETEENANEVIVEGEASNEAEATPVVEGEDANPETTEETNTVTETVENTVAEQ